jgi:hypothetical protein
MDPYWGGQVINNITLHGGPVPVDGWGPLVVFLPCGLIFGTSTNQTLVTSVFGAISVYFAYRLCQRLGLTRRQTILLAFSLFMGTALWWCAAFGGEWQVGSVFAVMCTLAALNQSKGWVVALLALGAANSRDADMLALPLYGYLTHHFNRAAFQSYVRVIAAFVPLYVAWMLYFYGVPYDIGHNLFYQIDTLASVGTTAPFQLTNLPLGIESLLFNSPLLVNGKGTVWPFFALNAHGLALTFASPFLLLATRAKSSRFTLALWLTAILTALPDLIYYADGWAEAQYRHALDFIPFLFVLIVIGAKRGIPRLGTVACWWSIGIGIWVVWYWASYY